MVAVIAAAALPLPDSNATGSPGRLRPRTGIGFGLSRPTWIVKTESNVPKEEIRKPDPPCVVCSGSGRVDCRHCQGRGAKFVVEVVLITATDALEQGNTETPWGFIS